MRQQEEDDANLADLEGDDEGEYDPEMDIDGEVITNQMFSFLFSHHSTSIAFSYSTAKQCHACYNAFLLPFCYDNISLPTFLGFVSNYIYNILGGRV